MLAPIMLGSLVVLGLSSVAAAQENPTITSAAPRHSAVEVRIGAVLASNTSKGFDPRLVSLQHQFNVLFPYTSYRLVKETRQQVPWGGRVGLDIPGGRYLMVIPKGFRNDRVTMKVVLIDGHRSIVDTALSLRNGGTLLVGGPRDPEGVLILSIGADKVD
jgi:hypothetical protein